MTRVRPVSLLYRACGTYIGIYPPRHAWGRWQHLTLTLGLPADAAGLRHQLADGQLKVIRRGMADGHKAIELGLTGLKPGKTGLHATAARLWVDAASYLPLRQVLQFSTGRQYMTDYRFFPPTAANLAKLRPVNPGGLPPDHAAAGSGAFQVNRWPNRASQPTPASATTRASSRP